MRKRNFDTELLRTFVTIADSSGFAQASKVLSLTQSAVSHQMRRLEDAIGMPLFERDGRRKKLTVQGEQVLNYSRKILELNDELWDRMQDAPEFTSIILGMPEYFAERLLPDIFRHFSLRNNDVRIEVRAESNNSLLKAAEEGAVDLAVVIGPPSAKSSKTIAFESLVWLGQSGATTRLDKENTVPLIAFEPPCPFRQTAINILNEARIKWDIVFTARSLADMKAAIQAGLGVTALPAMVISPTFMQFCYTGEALPPLPDLECRFIVSDTRPGPGIVDLQSTILSIWPEPRAC